MENIYCLVRMHNRKLNRDQNLIGGQMAIRNWTLEPLWCKAIYSWTRIKFRFDSGSKLNDGATRPNWLSKCTVYFRHLGWLLYTITQLLII